VRTPDRACYAAVRDAASAALLRGIGGRWELPAGGLLAIERPLPFLVIAATDHPSDAATLSGGLASRLLVPADSSHAPGVDALAHELLTLLAERTPAVVVLWLAAVEHEDGAPIVRVRLAPEARWDPLASALLAALSKLSLDEVATEVRLDRVRPHRSPFSLPAKLAARLCEVELEVPTLYREAHTGIVHPLWAEDVRRALASALAEVGDAFIERFLPNVRPRPRIGTSMLDAAAQRADRILCEADDGFEVLLQLTPANLKTMWDRLVETDFQEEPRVRYRPLPFDPVRIKRRVLEAPVEEVEDPFVAELLREKQEELDRMLSMLRDRGEMFLHESEQLYGRPSRRLVALATRILSAPRVSDEEHEPLALDAMLARARAHMRRYREQDPFFPTEIELRDDTAASMMVLHGRLVVRSDAALSERRLHALLEHEVGTHVLTWFNGSAQPLRLLGRGLAGYEALQEGLAVLAEHLAGALDPARLRILAARVIAADAVASGASFLEVLHRLYDDHGLSRRAAFQTTVRALRGGGLTKDLVYLRGLCELMAYLRDGGALAPLYTGKVALRHLPVITALEARGLLVAPRVLPEVLRGDSAKAAIEEIRAATDPFEMVARLAGADRAAKGSAA
jgi:uncharacterized protein (TIGR02421 family)